MGSRGAFVDVASGNFNFKEDGQEYYSLGTLSSDPNVKILALIGEGVDIHSKFFTYARTNLCRNTKGTSKISHILRRLSQQKSDSRSWSCT